MGGGRREVCWVDEAGRFGAGWKLGVVERFYKATNERGTVGTRQRQVPWRS